MIRKSLIASCLSLMFCFSVSASVDWKTRSDDLGRVYHYENGQLKGGYDISGKYYRAFKGKGVWGPKSLTPVPPRHLADDGTDALHLVNAQRKQAGLRPYLPDPKLTRAALACATYRARHRIQGHAGNDFAFLPPGASSNCAGCAAWADGFGACNILGGHTYCGAAWVRGADGLKYCHCFYR